MLMVVTDDRQTMGDDAGHPQHGAVQAGPRAGAVFPGQGWRGPGCGEYQFYEWHSWECVCPSPSSSTDSIYVCSSADCPSGQVNYSVAKAGVVGLTKTIAKEWGPGFNVRANTVAFGFVQTRLTAAKEAGAFVTTPDGTKVPLGIPGKQLASRAGDDQANAYPDIPLRRPASPEEAARAILGVASPLFSYVSGETIRVTGGRNM